MESCSRRSRVIDSSAMMAVCLSSAVHRSSWMAATATLSLASRSWAHVDGYSYFAGTSGFTDGGALVSVSMRTATSENFGRVARKFSGASPSTLAYFFQSVINAWLIVPPPPSHIHCSEISQAERCRAAYLFHPVDNFDEPHPTDELCDISA